MTSNKMKEKISKFISDKPSGWIAQAGEYEMNKDWRDKSALIAVRILSAIRNQSITQKKLAESIGISPQYINKVVKGQENLSLETICKIEKALGIVLVSVPVYEKSQVIIDSFLPSPAVISRHTSKPIGSDSTEYELFSNYQADEEPIAA